MNSLEEQLRRASSTVSLREQEREAMRDYLAEYRGFSPIRSVPASKKAHYTYAYEMFVRARARMLVWSLVGVMLMTTSGISYAAESAVPGDSLYLLKVNVNEEVVRMFSFGAEARAMWEARRAERRLEEASKLAHLGALTPERGRQVAEQFEKHVARVSETTGYIQNEDPLRASDMTNALENAFSAHEAILVSIAIDQQLSSESVRELAGKVRSVAHDFAQVHEQTEEMLAAVNGGDGADGAEGASVGTSATIGFDPSISSFDQRSLVSRMRRNADMSIRTVEQRISRLGVTGKHDLDTSRARLAEIKHAYDQALFNYHEGEYELSYAQFKAVRSVSDRLARFMEARRTLSVDALALDLAEELLFATATSSESDRPAATRIFETLDEKEATIEESVSALMLGDVLDPLGAPERSHVEDRLNQIRALVVRATLARETGDHEDARRYYERASEILAEVRAFLLDAEEIDLPPEEPEPEKGSEGEVGGLDDGEHATSSALLIKHVLSDGRHTFYGTLHNAAVCAAFDVSVVSSDADERKLELIFVADGSSDECVGTSSDVAFATTFTGADDAELISVTLDDQEINFSVVPDDSSLFGAVPDAAVIPGGTSSLEVSTGTQSTYRATSELMNRVLDDLMRRMRQY